MDDDGALGADLDFLDRVGRPNANLQIDEKVRQLQNPKRGPRLSARWKNLDDAIGFAHRSLEVAYHYKVDAAPEMKMREVVDGWRHDASEAAEARKALGNLLRSLCPIDPIFSRPDHLAKPLGRRIRYLNPGINFFASEGLAETEAATLIAAMRVLDGMPSYFSELGDAAEKLCRRERIFDRIEFLFPLAWAWQFLTGSLPGRSPDETKNPFLRFAMAGWLDIGGSPDTGFIRALAVVLDGGCSHGELPATPSAPFWFKG